MTSIKKITLFLAIVPLLKPISIKADTTNNILAVAASAGIAIIAGYGIYKVCESASFSNAQQTVSNAQDTLQELYTKNYCPLQTPDELFKKYRSNLSAYITFCQQVKHDVKTLEQLDNKLKTIENNWASTAYAQKMVKDIKSLLQDIGNILRCLVKQEIILDNFKSIIVLETMLNNEQNSPFLQILNSHNSLNTAIMSTYATSQWPYLQAYWDLSDRKQTYQDYLKQAHAWNNEFVYTISTAHRVIAAYAEAESLIISHPRYTEDRRYKQQYDNEQEKLRIEREKVAAAQRQAEAAQQQAYAAQRQAEAAHQQAYAMQQQAHALNQNNTQQLKNRLLELRIALTQTKNAIEQCWNWETDKIRNLKKQYNLLRAEAIEIRNKLYGCPDIIQLFVDVFSTSDYV